MRGCKSVSVRCERVRVYKKRTASSSDKKIGRGRRKIRWIDTVSEMTEEKGREKNLKFAENRLE